MSLDLCGLVKWRQLFNMEHLKRMFCTLYLSSQTSREILLVLSDSHGKALSTVDQLLCDSD